MSPGAKSFIAAQRRSMVSGSRSQCRASVHHAGQYSIRGQTSCIEIGEFLRREAKARAWGLEPPPIEIFVRCQPWSSRSSGRALSFGPQSRSGDGANSAAQAGLLSRPFPSAQVELLRVLLSYNVRRAHWRPVPSGRPNPRSPHLRMSASHPLSVADNERRCCGILPACLEERWPTDGVG